MSSAGSESPRSNSLNISRDIVLEKLCKKGATVTRASEFLNELSSRFSGSTGTNGLPDGITSLCAFIASEQLENKDVSVGLARTTSGLTWDRFWQSLSEVQDLLVKAAAASSQFRYLRLPSYVPPCDTCEGKNFDCVRKIAPSTKCQVCSIRKKVCTRQNDAHERRRKFEDVKPVHDDDTWLSDLDSEPEISQPERSKDVSQTIKRSKSSSPSTHLESLLNDIDASKKMSVKALPSPTLSPKWTTLEDTPSGLSSSHSKPHRQHFNADSSSLKRKHAASSETNGKKRRTDGHNSSAHKTPPGASDKPSVHLARPTVLQKSPVQCPNDKTVTNGNVDTYTLAPSLMRKYPRPPSPTSSDSGQGQSSSPPKASTSSSHRTHTDESKTLREALQKKAREVISHVEAKGCEGIGLRLHILDMKTRLVELDRIKSEPVPSKSSLMALNNMLRRAAEAVVLSLQSDGCPDVNLRLMVLDLDTRLSEMDKDR
ncbi:hypothetical protein BC835DRAFT_1377336 [Cytidiella melzeri]|nr:hypothetical protein BC835DRAFT_1377336 [Cytidiella melzeri]